MQDRLHSDQQQRRAPLVLYRRVRLLYQGPITLA